MANGEWRMVNGESALVDGDVVLIDGAGVFGAGTDEAVVGELLHHVSGPAGDPAHREGGREEVDGDAEDVVDAGAEEVDVGAEALLPEHDFLDPAGDLEEAPLAALLGERLRHLLQLPRAGVRGLV